MTALEVIPMEAVRTQPTMAIRTWRLLATSLLFLALVIGGTAGYAVRLTTSPTQTIVRTVTAPAASVSDQSDQSISASCVHLPPPLLGKGC